MIQMIPMVWVKFAAFIACVIGIMVFIAIVEASHHKSKQKRRGDGL